MRSKPLNRRVYRRKSLQGFTLMELMTVVIIVGVLSAIAVPTFSGYIYKSRTSEATEFLGVIRLREESYRSEFGVYCPTLASSPSSYSALDTNSNLVPDPTTTRRDAKPFVATTPWLQLGARPAGSVRFGYGVVAGTPTEAAALTNLGWTDATADYFFIARAVGDLNGDDKFCTFEIYSASKNVWIKDPKGRGWD